ncbi:MAG: Fused signal recognition particle receptor, partial [Verrucomicrobiaceae bacterium]|nr:Fused signal recognition particle receptor [Verrucomicrobiaceae bacterium]
MAGFFKSLITKFSKPDFDWDELEGALISGDLGPKLAMQIVDELKGQGRKLSGEDIVNVAREHV